MKTLRQCEPSREATIPRLHFGLEGTGAIMGLTRERIRQSQNLAPARLRLCMEERDCDSTVA